MGHAVKRFEALRARLERVDKMTRRQAVSWIAAHASDVHQDYVAEANEEWWRERRRIEVEATRQRDLRAKAFAKR